MQKQKEKTHPDLCILSTSSQELAVRAEAHAADVHIARFVGGVIG